MLEMAVDQMVALESVEIAVSPPRVASLPGELAVRCCVLAVMVVLVAAAGAAALPTTEVMVVLVVLVVLVVAMVVRVVAQQGLVAVVVPALVVPSLISKVLSLSSIARWLKTSLSVELVVAIGMVVRAALVLEWVVRFLITKAKLTSWTP